MPSVAQEKLILNIIGIANFRVLLNVFIMTSLVINYNFRLMVMSNMSTICYQMCKYLHYDDPYQNQSTGSLYL